MRAVQTERQRQRPGLSADPLRDSARRGLINPALPPAGPGSCVGYSWHTVLLSKLAVVWELLQVQLQAQRILFSNLSQKLAKTSFAALRELARVVRPQGDFHFLSAESIVSVRGDYLFLQLDGHVSIFPTGCGSLDPTAQLSLSQAVAVR